MNRDSLLVGFDGFMLIVIGKTKLTKPLCRSLILFDGKLVMSASMSQRQAGKAIIAEVKIKACLTTVNKAFDFTFATVTVDN